MNASQNAQPNAPKPAPVQSAGNFARFNTRIEGAIHTSAQIQDIPLRNGGTMKQCRTYFMSKEKQSDGSVAMMRVAATFPVNGPDDVAVAEQLKAGALVVVTGVQSFRVYQLKDANQQPAIVACDPDVNGGLCEVVLSRQGRKMNAEGVEVSIRCTSSDFHIITQADVAKTVANIQVGASIYEDMEESDSTKEAEGQVAVAVA